MSDTYNFGPTIPALFAAHEARYKEAEVLINSLQQQLIDCREDHKKCINAIDNEMVSSHLGVFNKYDNPVEAIKKLMDWSQSLGEYFAEERYKNILSIKDGALKAWQTCDLDEEMCDRALKAQYNPKDKND